MSPEERIQAVCEALYAVDKNQLAESSYYSRMAKAAIAAADATRPKLVVTDAMVEAVYAKRWRQEPKPNTGCAIENVKVAIRDDLEDALKVMES